MIKNLEKKNKFKEFNFDNSFDFIRILRNYCLKINNSWSIRWYASMYLKNKLTLFPPKSFIQNIGMDGSGVHASNIEDYKSEIIKEYIKPKKIKVKESKYHFKKMKLFFDKSENKRTFLNTIKKKIKFIK